MIFDNLTSLSDKLNACVDKLTALPINISNYFLRHLEKYYLGSIVANRSKGKKIREQTFTKCFTLVEKH